MHKELHEAVDQAVWDVNEALSHLSEYMDRCGNGDVRSEPEDTTPREAWTRARASMMVLVDAARKAKT